MLFELFLTITRSLADGAPASSPLALLPGMARDIAVLAVGGAVVGLVLGWLTLRLLRVLRRTNCSMAQEVGAIQAMSFFTFYLANAPLGVSGVIAVVVFGLFGSATSKFELANSGGRVARVWGGGAGAGKRVAPC